MGADIHGRRARGLIDTLGDARRIFSGLDRLRTVDDRKRRRNQPSGPCDDNAHRRLPFTEQRCLSAGIALHGCLCLVPMARVVPVRRRIPARAVAYSGAADAICEDAALPEEESLSRIFYLSNQFLPISFCRKTKPRASVFVRWAADGSRADAAGKGARP
jgi:hypothetical protein